MTTVTTVLALVPMALDHHEGFEIRIPLAMTLIGGLIFGTFLTLIFIPLVYSVVVGETAADVVSERGLKKQLKKPGSRQAEKPEPSES